MSPPSLVSRLRDPAVSTSVVLAAIVISGFVAFVVGWRGVAAALFVPTQVAFMASAGIGGVALILVGLGLLSGHLNRRDEAVSRALLDDVLRDTTDLVDSLRLR